MFFKLNVTAAIIAIMNVHIICFSVTYFLQRITAYFVQKFDNFIQWAAANACDYFLQNLGAKTKNKHCVIVKNS